MDNMVNSEKPLVSLIIRVKNEERWIGPCLRAVFEQTYKNFEVIIVDNCSTDQTLSHARLFPVKIINITDFFPGKAINDGIRHSRGEYIVCLSGHCIPTNSDWLMNLVRDLVNPDVAGVYGRQEPLSFSSDLDKRDLITVFGLDKKVQIKDSFFHNANSAFRREIWELYPFDESVTNIEDRVWGRKVIEAGMKIIYEPEASVFHWHGINHELNSERAKQIVRILEGLDAKTLNSNLDNLENLNIVAIVPIRGVSRQIGNKSLLEYTLLAANQSKLIKRVVVSADSHDMAELAKSLGAFAPFIRPISLSEDYVDISDVLKYSLNKIEQLYGVPDLVVLLEETYPFRTPQLIDQMVSYLVKNGMDTVLAAKSEARGIFTDTERGAHLLAEGFMPTSLKSNRAMVGLTGLACITYPNFIREGALFGNRLGVFAVEDAFSAIQIRDYSSQLLAEKLISDWWEAHY